MNETKAKVSGITWVIVGAVCFAGCSSSSETSGIDAGIDASDAGASDGSSKTDAMRSDSGTADTGPDSRSHDSGSDDTGSSDADRETGLDDTGSGDSSRDSSLGEGGTSDSSPDTGSDDTGPLDSSASDVGLGDGSAIESGSTDAGPGDSGANDSMSDDSGEAGATCVGDGGDVTPGTQQCFDTSTVMTCGANGEWGNLWSCTTGTCNNGACTGSTTTGTSCAPGGAGMTNCGVAGNESCCTSLDVPGGTYYRAYTSAADGSPTAEAYPATVSGFALDKYLVTVARFRQYVNYLVGGGSPPANGNGKHTHLNNGQGLAEILLPGTYESGWNAAEGNAYIETLTNGVGDHETNLLCNASGNILPYDAYATWTATAGTQENLPINCLIVLEAYAFCIWDGGFLPSEAEWEYAAAGGSQQREYPWGSTDPGTTNQYAIYGCNYSGSGTCSDVSNIAPVGIATLGAGAWGQLDLAGELNEWIFDPWVPYDYTVNPCIDCTYGSPGAGVVVVPGGDFGSDSEGLFPPIRSVQAPGVNSAHSVGFRCARAP